MLIHLVMSSDKKDLIQKIILESSAYKNMDMIESLIQEGMDLTHIPIQPLYHAIRSLPSQEISELLPRMSKDQRQSFLDLDLWAKDDLDVNQFGNWIDIYNKTDNDEIIQEFVQGNQFALYLKGVFNVWTFDVEDPLYPDHDNYFLTEDSLLLFEFHKDYEYVSEARELVKNLYSELGVEMAYTHLFKVLVESYLIVQEDEYQDKCFRLKELGFVDWIEALEIHNNFPSRQLLDNFIKKKIALTATIESIGRCQTLPENSLIAFKNEISGMSEQLSEIDDEKRQDYLHFNFLRMINSGLTLEDAMRHGTVAMTRVGKRTRSMLELGYDYIMNFEGNKNSNIFEKFDFTDIFKVGNSLICNNQKDLKNSIAKTALSRQDGFLGRYWADFIDNSFDFPVKFVDIYGAGSKPKAVVNQSLFLNWEQRVQTLINLLPFADQFFLNYKDLTESSKIRDEFYLNYNVDEIDLESILMSTFANFVLGNFDKENVNRMGLTVDEYKRFSDGLMADGKVDKNSENGQKIDAFIEKFGMNNVLGLDNYLLGILTEQMEGYDYTNLSTEDFKHVGGPILLVG
ncbi:MAG: hypothetical protein KC493_06735 [Bacteriovoracaceae bacterium]|nr:hypothetical protein [Bacteriovoracaceae bacterium]